MTLESLFYKAYSGFVGVSDLNVVPTFVQSGSFSAAGDCNVRWQAFVLPSHGLSSMEDLSAHRGTTLRGSSRQDADLCRTLPHTGLCSTHVESRILGIGIRTDITPQFEGGLSASYASSTVGSSSSTTSMTGVKFQLGFKVTPQFQLMAGVASNQSGSAPAVNAVDVGMRFFY